MADCSDGTATASDWVLFIHTTSNFWRNSRMTANFSGDTAPTVSGTYAVWYDTANNYIKYTSDNGVTWISSNTSFPICTFTRTEGTASSIDQVFEGFGYIGSIVFALPGVKGVVPNGRNIDGSLNNIEITTTKVSIKDVNTTGEKWIAISSVGVADFATKSVWTYDEKTNLIFNASGSKLFYCFCGDFTKTTDSILNWKPKTTFRAVDYNDSSWLSGLGMPSGKYVDLTLGNSGSRYIMPANGYILFSKQQAAANEKISLFLRHPTLDDTNILATEVSDARNYVNLKAWLPVPKSGEIEVQYDATGNTTAFRFYYAEGEQ